MKWPKLGINTFPGYLIMFCYGVLVFILAPIISAMAAITPETEFYKELRKSK